MAASQDWREYSKKVLGAFEESGEINPLIDRFICYGNPVNPRYIVVFEKDAVFNLAVKELGFSPSFALTICSLGVPSKSLLKQLEKLRKTQIFYFGDLDPLSIHTYLSLKHLKPRPQPRDTVKTKIKFCGITVQDHKKHNLSSVEIPMNNDEKNLVDYLYIYGIPELKEEIILLKNGGRKVEMEGLSTKFKYYDTGNGPKSTSREIWLKEFKRYFFDKLSEISKE